MTVRLEELFPEELQAHLERRPLLVLPLGTIEWHSHHLPLGLDGIVAAGLGERIAEQADAVLAPTSYWAVGGVPYPFTLNLSLDGVEALYEQVFQEFDRIGFRLIIAFTGHFGLAQTLALKRAAAEVMQRSSVIVLPLAEYDLTTDDLYRGDHAGIGETSLLWALRPDLVRLDAVPAEEPLDGVIGEDPRGEASRAYGEQLLEVIAKRAGTLAQNLWEASPLERADFLSALQAGVRVLKKTYDQRQIHPKSEVPSIGSPAYLGHLQALYRGDYREARKLAERKLADLKQ